MPFFTHQIKESGSLLYAFPLFDSYEITADLKKTGIESISVTLNLRADERAAKSANPNHAYNRSYSLKFDASTTKRSQVEDVRFLLHHGCRWRKFQASANGPTVCFICSMIGHGMKTCHREEVCTICAGSHLASACTNRKPKCANCVFNNLDPNHLATDANCPSRIAHQERRRAANKGPGKPTLPKAQQKPAITLPRRDRFPSMASINSSTYADAVKSRAAQPSDDLFTIEEITTIMFEAMNDLQRCRSKFDQMQVITRLLQKCLN